MTLKPRSTQLLLVGAALLWCVGFGYWLWVTPVQVVEQRKESITSQASGPAPAIVRTRSFAELSGPVPLVIPVVLAGLASLAAAMKWSVALGSAAVLLSVFALLTAFSVGLGYAPAAAVLLGAWAASSDATARVA